MGSDPKEWWPDDYSDWLEDDPAAEWWEPRDWRTESKDKMNIKLTNVRLSFPALFKAKGFGDDEDAKKSFGAVFLLNKKKHADLIEQVEEAIEKVKKEKWGKKIPKLKGVCLNDGADKEDVDGYGDKVMYIPTRSAKRVPVVDVDPSVPLAEEDGKPYGGCYVNASIRIWAQDNQYGMRVNAALRAVQFYKDGEPFGEKPADAEEEFEDVSNDSDDDDEDEKPRKSKKNKLL